MLGIDHIHDNAAFKHFGEAYVELHLVAIHALSLSDAPPYELLFFFSVVLSAEKRED